VVPVLRLAYSQSFLVQDRQNNSIFEGLVTSAVIVHKPKYDNLYAKILQIYVLKRRRYHFQLTLIMGAYERDRMVQSV
jgi:hypothetical protein